MKNAIYPLVKILREKKLSLALAESMTAGLVAHQLSNVKGISEVLKGSIVCYNETVKINLCGVKGSLIEQCTAESQEVTDALAQNLSKLIEADIHAGITGLAASGGSESPQKPVGTVFFSVLYKNQIHRLEKQFKGPPLKIKKSACQALYKFIASLVE